MRWPIDWNTSPHTIFTLMIRVLNIFARASRSIALVSRSFIEVFSVRLAISSIFQIIHIIIYILEGIFESDVSFVKVDRSH